MNKDILKGKWKQLRGRVREQWGELTNDEIDQIAGKRDQLIGTIQEKYSYTRAKAEQEVNDFLENTEFDFDQVKQN